VGWLVNGFIPGSVIGMMLLFTALCLKWVKPERIKPVARFLCDNMALFFVPAGVGIVNALDILSQYWQAVLVACAVSTVMVICRRGLRYNNGLRNTGKERKTVDLEM